MAQLPLSQESLQIMFKKQFTPVPSDNESDTQDADTEVDFEAFNSNYSLVYNVSKEFFAQCRKSITKYLNFSKMGVKVNVGGVLAWLNQAQNSLDESKQAKLDTLRKKKQKEFDEILARIRQLVSDMIDFERNFKQEFNETCHKSANEQPLPVPRQENPMKKFEKSVYSETTKQSEVTINTYSSSKMSEHNEEAVEEALRKQLRRIVLPKPIALKSDEVLPKDLKSTVQRISQKMVFLSSQMKLEKERETKILEIFNRNKIIIPDIDAGNPIVSQLESDLESIKQELTKVKAQLSTKKKEHDKLAARLLLEMTREDQLPGDVVFQNDDYTVLLVRKNKKKQVEKPKIMGLGCRNLLSYIYMLQQRIAFLLQTKKKGGTETEEQPPHKPPSTINLNMCFTNAYSPTEIRNKKYPDPLKK